MSTLTKIFIILQLVFCITLSVMVAMWVSSQPKYKDQVEAQLKMTIAAQAALAREEAISNGRSNAVAQLAAALQFEQNAGKQRLLDSANSIAGLERDKADLQGRINDVDATNRQYAATIQQLKDQYTTVASQLTTTQSDNLKQLRRAEELARINESVTNERDQLAKALKRTQDELVAVSDELRQLKDHPTAAGGAAGGGMSGGIAEAGVMTVKTAINGKVIRVNDSDGKTYFALDLGKRDNLQNGLSLIISRNNSYVGDAIVVNTTVDESVAQVKVLKRGVMVQAGDIVIVSVQR